MFLKRILTVTVLIFGLTFTHLASAQNTSPKKTDPSPSPSLSAENKKSQKESEGAKAPQETKAADDKEKDKKASAVIPPKAQREPSEKLFFIATPTIDTSKEGVVVIDSTNAPGSYRSLRIKNEGQTEIDLTHVQIVYSDGRVHNEDRLINIKTGERTRKIAESTSDKFIDRITLSWKATGGQTKVQVIGYQTAEGRKMQRPHPPLAHNIPLPPSVQGLQEKNQAAPKIVPVQPKEGANVSSDAAKLNPAPLIILPEKNIFFAAPRINLSKDGTFAIDIRKAKGAFRSVRIRNEGGNVVDLTQIQILYSDGTVHSEDRPITIQKGERTKKIADTPIDKFIDKITLSWKASIGQTKIQVIGYQTAEGLKMERSGSPLSQNIPLPPANQVPIEAPQIASENKATPAQDANTPVQEEASSPLVNKPEKPVFFASPKIDLSIDGTITIDTEKTEGAFRSVRIRNKGGSLINLTNVQITYNDGSTHNEDRLINIRKGERTKKIAETANDKFIDRITLSWKATGGQSKLQIIGYQTSAGRSMDRSSSNISQNIPLPSTGAPPLSMGPTLPSSASSGSQTTEDMTTIGQNNRSETKTELAPSSLAIPSALPNQQAKLEEQAPAPYGPVMSDGETTTQLSTSGTTEVSKADIPPYQEQDKTNIFPSVSPPPPLTPLDTKDVSYPGDEILLGYQNISLSIERHNIKINPEIGKIGHIRFSAGTSEVQITSLKVLYSDGSFQDITLNADLRDQVPSPWIELHGDKFIREIEYNNQTKKNSKEVARIEILGQHVKGWLIGNGEGKKFNQGWVLLGAKTTSFKNIDKDTFRIADNDGGLTKVKIIAKERPLTLREIRVIYFSGPDEVFTIKDRVDPQKPYGPLEFRGGRSAVKEIQVKYRARIDLANGLNNIVEGSPAIVEIWGQY
ncbi:MAG: hypothetical protein ACKOW3_09845 [Hyphomicrobium sp.]